MDEQPNLWRLLHRQDDLSRQRCTKPRGRCVFESNQITIFARNFRNSLRTDYVAFLFPFQDIDGLEAEISYAMPLPASLA